MKNLISQLFWGKGSKFSGLIALGIIGMIALGCTCGKNFDFANLGQSANSNSSASNSSSDTPFTSADDDTVPADPVLESMIKQTTADFAQAIESDDFSELYNKSSSDFQSTYTEEQMKDVFKTFVTQKRQLLPSLNKVPAAKPEYTTPPAIRKEKGLSILVANGKYPTKPLNVKFEYEWVFRGGEWKLLKLIVKM